MKKSNRTFTVEVLNWFCLGLLSLVFLVGCGGGGGGGGGPEDEGSFPAKVTTLQGSAFVPGGGTTSKPTRNKPLPENGPFVGADVVALSLTNGVSYPLGSITLAGMEGDFKIQEVPTGHDYLVKAKKGNKIVLKVIRVPEDTPNTFDIGEVDAASTSVALMLEHLIREVLGQVDFNITRPGNNVNPEQLEEAIRNADLAALEQLVVELATKVEELDNDVEALKNELASSNGVEYSDKVAIVNIYNILVQVLNVSDPNTNGQGRDALDEWRHDGKIGGVDVNIVAAQITAVVDNNGVLVNISVNQVGVVPTDLSDGLKTITKPQTTITSKPENPTTSTSASFSFVSSRPNSTFQCQLDGGEFSNCTSPKEYSALAIGQHTFCVVATDKDGVKDPSEACYPWVIFHDDPVPQTTITNPPNDPSDPSNSPSVTFTFVSDVLGSSFQCELDGGGFSACTSPKNYPNVGIGPHIFKVFAINPEGEVDPTPAERSWTVIIDVDPPETTITDGPPNPSDSMSATFTFVSDETGSTFQCKLNDGESVGCTSPAKYDGMTNGTHTFSVFAIDAAGNPDPIPATYTWTKVEDVTPPVTTIDSAPPDQAASPSARFTFSSNEPGSTFTCDLDGGGFSACTSPKDYTALSLGEHTFCVVARDGANNSDLTPACWTWTITDIPPIFSWNFDVGNGQGTWSADTGVWQIGTPTVVGPGGCFSEPQCAGTELAGNYPPDTDSHLISPTIQLPSVTEPEEIHLRFRTWFSYGGGDSAVVQISVRDLATSTWGPWVSEGATIVDNSGWSLKDVDLTAYAGKIIRIGFFHTASRGCCDGEGPGWYIDDIVVLKKVPEFAGDFEAGWGDWGTDRGVWQVGTPTTVPAGCFNGSTQCVGTELDGDYGPNTDSRLISPTMALPTLASLEEIHLRFQQWFSYGGGDSGVVQVSVRDPETLAWGPWVSEGTTIVDNSGWSLKDVDLTAYAGKTIRLAFFHTASRGCCDGEAPGWYIDDVVLLKKAPQFTGNFEAGWGDWGADRGVWQVGTPTVGPPVNQRCFAGTQCAGTELAGNYGPNTDSRLVSPTMQLPVVSGLEEVHLRFQHWFSYGGGDSGTVQVSVWDPATLIWGSWVNEGTAIVNNSGWSLKDIDLTAYAGKTVRIGFFHTASRGCCDGEGPGWYIDDVSIQVF